MIWRKNNQKEFKSTFINNSEFDSRPQSYSPISLKSDITYSYFDNYSSRHLNRNPFFTKRQERKESKSEAHRDNIKEVFIKWSDLHIDKSRKKNPFYVNLYLDIFDKIESLDINHEAYSHLRSAKDTDYKKTHTNYVRIKQLQKENNETIENLVDNLKEKISITNPENLVDYIIGLFIKRNLHNSVNINTEIEKIKENHTDIIFISPNENDVGRKIAENSCKLFSIEEKNTFNHLIDNELQEIIRILKNYDNGLKEIKFELESFRTNCIKIARDMDTVDLKGECEKEVHFSIRYKFKKKLLNR